MRIVASLASAEFDPVLLVLRNCEVAKALTGEKPIAAPTVVVAFGKDFGQQWMEPLTLEIEKELSATTLARRAYQQGVVLHDLVDHLEDPMLSDWYPNSNFVNLVQK
jgi:hypothetical protein